MKCKLLAVGIIGLAMALSACNRQPSAPSGVTQATGTESPAASEPHQPVGQTDPADELPPPLAPAELPPIPDSNDPPMDPPLPDPYPGLVRFDPKGNVWADEKKKSIVLVGQVCLRRGPLELFACLKGTKEHESILTVQAKAENVHVGLAAMGAEAGGPAEFPRLIDGGDPKTYTPFKPARGTEIEITLHWQDEMGNEQSARAQDWVRDVKSKTPLAHPWVFAGSGFWEDEGVRHYMAEGGDLICVSNFPTAMLDLAVESTQADSALLFDAFEQPIPPKQTLVRITLTPKIKAEE